MNKKVWNIEEKVSKYRKMLTQKVQTKPSSKPTELSSNAKM